MPISISTLVRFLQLTVVLFASASRIVDGRRGTIVLHDESLEDKVFTGMILDKDSKSIFDHLSSNKRITPRTVYGERKRSSSSGIPIILNLPDANSSTRSLTSFPFTCNENSSKSQQRSDSTSFFICSEAPSDRRRTTTKQPSDDDILDGGMMKAFIGINGPYMSGIIESPSLRYEIRTNMERDENNTISNMWYSFVAGRPEDVAYEHVGLPVDDPEEGTNQELFDDGLDPPNNTRRSLLRNNRQGPSNKSSSATEVLMNVPAVSSSVKRDLSEDDGSEIDLLMYFTARGACQWINQPYPCVMDAAAMGLLETYVETFVQYTNDIWSRSEIDDLTVLSVHIGIDPSYDETTSPNTGIILNHLTVTNDGFLDNAHVLRDQYSADLIVGIIYHPPYASAGIAWVPKTQPSPYYGMSVTGGPYPLLSLVAVHEIGHNLGCNHHRSQYPDPDPLDYHFGYANCSQCWTSIMSYRSVCASSCSSVDWIPYFSNPGVFYDGGGGLVPTGTTENNNALQISEARVGAAKNRYRGQRTIYKTSGSYYSSGDLFYEVVAKQDITINNFELYLDIGSRQVEISYARSAYDGQEYNDSFWTLVANDVVTPISDINRQKLLPIGNLNTQMGIRLTAGETISIRMRMPEGNVRVLALFGSSFGSTAAENDSLIIKGGKRGNGASFNSFPCTIYGGIVYSLDSTSPPVPEPSARPTSSPFPTDSPSSQPSKSPTLLPTNSPTDTPTTASPSDSPTTSPTCSNGGVNIKLEVKTDSWPMETSWRLEDTDSGANIKSISRYWSGNRLYEYSFDCLSPACYKFSIFDTHGDGINSPGYYSLKVNGKVIASSLDDAAGNFGREESINFGFCEDETNNPSLTPSSIPSVIPTSIPSSTPTNTPTETQSSSPSSSPSAHPSLIPSAAPSLYASSSPSSSPSSIPSVTSSTLPSSLPSLEPSSMPSPSLDPTSIPSSVPSVNPSSLPSVAPTASPSAEPSSSPSVTSSSVPSSSPTALPTCANGGINVKLNLQMDAHPSETSWRLDDITSGTNIKSIFRYYIAHKSYEYSLDCLAPTSCYKFSMLDSRGDGIDSTVSGMYGYYSLMVDGQVIATSLDDVDGNFGREESITFGICEDNETINPSLATSVLPSNVPTSNPSMLSTTMPSYIPLISNAPIQSPSAEPSIKPSDYPSQIPSTVPSLLSSSTPSMNMNPTNYPSYSPSISPSSTPTSDSIETPICSDDISWRWKGKSSKHCGWVYMSPSKRCSKLSAEDVPASEACPIACGDLRTKSCDIPNCGNDSWFHWVRNKKSKSCYDYLHRHGSFLGRGRCRSLGVTALSNDPKFFAYEYCSRCNACVP